MDDLMLRLAADGWVTRLFVLVMLGGALLKGRQILLPTVLYQGAPERRLQLVRIPAAPPRQTARLTAALERLGFRPLGQLVLPVPQLFRGGAADGPQRPEHVVWTLVTDDATTSAEVLGFGEGCGLVTTFRDGAAVQTTYGFGERRVDRDLLMQRTRSVEEMVAVHQRAVARFAAERGEPRAVRTLDDHMRDDASFRGRFARRTLQGVFVRNVVTNGATAGVLLFIAMVTLFV
jgi:hypothetical protein